MPNVFSTYLAALDLPEDDSPTKHRIIGLSKFGLINCANSGHSYTGVTILYLTHALYTSSAILHLSSVSTLNLSHEKHKQFSL